MKPASPDPRRLDVAAFSKARATLEGHLATAVLERLATATVVPADGRPGDVAWAIRGLWRQPTSGEPEIRLHLQARTTVHMVCQRCLQPVAITLDVDRTIRFVPGEERAAQLDEELEEDVLALPRALDLTALIEDELILALPIVPVHEACPEPLAYQAAPATEVGAAEAPAAERENPFAVLAALKRPPRP